MCGFFFVNSVKGRVEEAVFFEVFRFRVVGGFRDGKAGVWFFW